MKSELIKFNAAIIVHSQGEKEQWLFRLCFALEAEIIAFKVFAKWLQCAHTNLSIQCLSGIQMCHIG